jgi:hypothetical protein
MAVPQSQILSGILRKIRIIPEPELIIVLFGEFVCRHEIPLAGDFIPDI